MKEENKITKEEGSESNSKEEDEDLLYTHKPENRGNTMQWNPTFCRRPGH